MEFDSDDSFILPYSISVEENDHYLAEDSTCEISVYVVLIERFDSDDYFILPYPIVIGWRTHTHK